MGVSIPKEFKVVLNGANYLLSFHEDGKEKIVKIQFYNKALFEEANPGVKHKVFKCKS